MGYSGQDIEVRSDLTAGISDEELKPPASTTAHVAMTFPSAPTVSVVVLCCGIEYQSENLNSAASLYASKIHQRSRDSAQ
jgi:hypothetical protein